MVQDWNMLGILGLWPKVWACMLPPVGDSAEWTLEVPRKENGLGTGQVELTPHPKEISYQL